MREYPVRLFVQFASGLQVVELQDTRAFVREDGSIYTVRGVGMRQGVGRLPEGYLPTELGVIKTDEWTVVESSNLDAVWFGGKETDILRVRFKNGSVYEYLRVTRQHYEELLAAESIGSHFNRIIKTLYDGTRVDA